MENKIDSTINRGHATDHQRPLITTRRFKDLLCMTFIQKRTTNVCPYQHMTLKN